jgi:hypothetical protein
MEKPSIPIVPIVTILLALIIIGVMFWLAINIYPDSVAQAAKLNDLEKIQRLKLDARKSLLDMLQLGAAIVGSMGLVGTLIYTAKNFLVAEKTYRITEVSKVIEGYAKAMEQFASTNPDVRIGAIYMLGRIAQHSPDAHWNIMHHLCAYLSRHRSIQQGDAAQEIEGKDEMDAILSVLRNRRHDYEQDDEELVLSSTILDGADFRNSVLRCARFQFSDLSSARFQYSDLRDATFFCANLQRTNFEQADLRGAEFRGVVFDGTRFTRARLSGAKFEESSGFVMADNWYTKLWLRYHTKIDVNLKIGILR